MALTKRFNLKETNLRKKLVGIAIFIILVEFLTILIANNHYHMSTVRSQREFDEDFIQYLKSSDNTLKQVDSSGEATKYNSSVIYTSACDISSAYSILKHTSFSKEKLGHSILLERYKLVFINLSLSELISNSKNFTNYMDDIIKDPYSVNKISKFYMFLRNIKY